MRIREGELQSLAAGLVDALVAQGFFHLKQDRVRVEQRIVELIARNLAEEEALEKEAEQLAVSHARAMVGMDQRKIIQGIKERLARERNFTL